VPESPEHDELAARLRSVLLAWLIRLAKPGAVRRNLAVRWDVKHPRVGVDPDVCWLPSLPPGWDEGEIGSLKLWEAGHVAPSLAIEFVSRSHPYKDYERVQDKYAAVGVEELWVYDNRLFGPKRAGGPTLLQLWSRTNQGVLVRRHHDDTPVRSPLLGAWLLPRFGDHLLLAEHQDGSQPWPSLEEAAGERADQERARADQLQAELERLRKRKL
jgi:Uma2 family endonuclease